MAGFPELHPRPNRAPSSPSPGCTRDERRQAPSADGASPSAGAAPGAARAPRDLPGALERAGRPRPAPLRDPRARARPHVRRPGVRLRAPALHAVRPGRAGRLLVQGPRLLPLVRRPAHGRHRRAPRRRGPTRGPRAPVGAHLPLPHPLPPGLRPRPVQRPCAARCAASSSAPSWAGCASAPRQPARPAAARARWSSLSGSA